VKNKVKNIFLIKKLIKKIKLSAQQIDFLHAPILNKFPNDTSFIPVNRRYSRLVACLLSTSFFGGGRRRRWWRMVFSHHHFNHTPLQRWSPSPRTKWSSGKGWRWRWRRWRWLAVGLFLLLVLRGNIKSI
jgi:hypothetical protein